MKRILAGLIAAGLWAGPNLSNAQMRNENILADMPDGYKIATQSRKNGITQVEMIPRDQSLENWQDMFIVRIFHNSPQSLKALELQTTRNWFAACDKAAYKPDNRGTENGYEYSFFFLNCPQLAGSKEPMSRMVKIMRGRDSLYLTQMVFRRVITPEMARQWTPFMTKISLCDTRDEARACPPGL